MYSYKEWLQDLESIKGVDQQRTFIHRSLKSKKHVHIFGKYFFPHVIEGTYEVPKCHKEMLAELNSPNDSAIIFPRQHAKSTWTKIDILHDIVYKHELVILYVSVVMREAKSHFEAMRSELQNNSLLIGVYGDLTPNKDGKWTNEHFETSNGVNVVARGATKGRGVNIKNKRPTKIILDDIETDEHIVSAAQRDKLHRWLTHVIIPSRDKKKGKVKMVGTVLHQQSELLRFYKKHGGIFKKAIEDGKSIWPEYWTLDDLEEEREKIGDRAFMQEYMNEPLNPDLANINQDWIDDNIFVHLPNIKKQLHIVIYSDPQAGTSKNADEYAHTVLGFYPRDPHRYVLEQVCGRESQLTQAQEIIELWHKWSNKAKVIVVGVEKVLNQTAVFQNIISWKNGQLNLNTKINNKNIPIKAVSPKDAKSKWGNDKLGRLQMHEPAFKRGEIHLKPHMKKLRNQILYLGTDLLDHDDRVDSLVGALELTYHNMIQLKGTDASRKTRTQAGNLFKTQF